MAASKTLVPMAAGGEGNFLVPNFTFVVELFAFVIIVFVLGKYVIPPVNRAMAERQDLIKKQFDDLEQAKVDANAAEESFKAQFADARLEAARIREDAREQGALIIAEMRQHATEESERILRHARSQLEAERQQTVQQLRVEVGTMATTLAGTIIGESLEDDERRSRTVERFVASLESTDASASSGVS